MQKDNFVRFCLACIVLLLAAIAFRANAPGDVLAAEPTEYLVTNPGGSIDQATTKIINARRAQGWKLHTAGIGGAMIWYK